MYSYLSGRLVEKLPTAVVIDVQGVGYHVQIPVSTFSALPSLGETVKLLTHFVVREDHQALYGFATAEERDMFRLLMSVSGIGPKMAVTVLSGIAIEELKKAIIDGSLVVLTQISGIGRKTAERIIVELREKIVLDKRSAGTPLTELVRANEQLVDDSVQALVSLGYKKQSAKEAVQKVLCQPDSAKNSVQELIRSALKFV